MHVIHNSYYAPDNRQEIQNDQGGIAVNQVQLPEMISDSEIVSDGNDSIW